MRFSIGMFLLMVTFCSSAQEDLSSIKKNLDFKNGLDNWTISETFPTKVITGKQGAKTENTVHIKNDSVKYIGYFTQEVDLEFDKLMLLEIKGRIQAELSDSNATVALFAYTKEGEKWIQYQPTYHPSKSSVDQWTEFSTEIWLHSRADLLGFGAFLEGKGTMFIDYLDMVVKETESCKNTSHLDFRKECLSQILQHSLFKADLDSLALSADWDHLRGCDTSKAALDESLDLLLKSVDSHSFYLNTEKVQDWENTGSDPDANIAMTTGKAIDPSIAYLDMPFLMSGDSITQTLFADSMQNLIESLDHPGLEGWVLDLRNNGGGNCWPMLAGIGPILGEGTSGYFEEDGNFQAWIYSNGVAAQDTSVQTTISRSPYLPFTQNPKVAVLVSNRTGSSGEIVALAFKNRENAKLFGSKTAMYTTGNNNFTMSDGSMIFLATSIYCDRLKNLYPEGIEPDIAIETTGEEDVVLRAALEWLKAK